MTTIYRDLGKTAKRCRVSALLCLASVLAPVLLTGCVKGPHFDDGGLVAALSWLDEDDEKTIISDARLWVYGPEEAHQAASLHFGSAAELAASITRVEEGRYTVAGTCNLVPPFSAASGDGLEFSLSEPGANPAHAFYGVAEVNIDDRGKITVADIAIRRVLSELTIIIEEAPTGAKLSGEVLDAAQSLFPMRRNPDGVFGLPSDRKSTVALPETAASEGSIEMPTLRLMPTASGQEFSHLRILLSTAEDETFEFRIEAPLMRPAGKYVVTLNYGQMRPYMRLSVHNINDWTEGWIYNGEILDPDAAPSSPGHPSQCETGTVPCKTIKQTK